MLKSIIFATCVLTVVSAGHYEAAPSFSAPAYQQSYYSAPANRPRMLAGNDEEQNKDLKSLLQTPENLDETNELETYVSQLQKGRSPKSEPAGPSVVQNQDLVSLLQILDKNLDEIIEHPVTLEQNELKKRVNQLTNQNQNLKNALRVLKNASHNGAAPSYGALSYDATKSSYGAAPSYGASSHGAAKSSYVAASSYHAPAYEKKSYSAPSYSSPSYSAPSSYAAPAYSAPSSYAAPAYSAPSSYAAPAYSAPSSYAARAYSAPSSYAARAYSARSSYAAPAYEHSSYSAPSWHEK